MDHGKARISGGWHPLPGGLDLYAGIPPRLRWAAELKVEAICQQVWDTIKLSAGLHAGDFPHAYLVAAATHVAFEYSDGRELYAQTHPRRLSFCDLIADSALQWIEDLTYSGRPQRTPDAVAVARLTALPAWYGYELRLVRIDVPPDANELCFDGG